MTPAWRVLAAKRFRRTRIFSVLFLDLMFSSISGKAVVTFYWSSCSDLIFPVLFFANSWTRSSMSFAAYTFLLFSLFAVTSSTAFGVWLLHPYVTTPEPSVANVSINYDYKKPWIQCIFSSLPKCFLVGSNKTDYTADQGVDHIVNGTSYFNCYHFSQRNISTLCGLGARPGRRPQLRRMPTLHPKRAV